MKPAYRKPKNINEFFRAPQTNNAKRHISEAFYENISESFIKHFQTEVSRLS